MIDREYLQFLGASEKHLRLADFLAEQTESAHFVDYASLNLMAIPDLVPHIWVLDFRDGISAGLLFKFSGTKIDERFGENLMGKRLEEVYDGHFNDQVFNAYRDVYRKRQGVFVTRSDFYERHGENSERSIAVMLLPCSSNGLKINYGLGLTTFELTDNSDLAEPQITFL